MPQFLSCNNPSHATSLISRSLSFHNLSHATSSPISRLKTLIIEKPMASNFHASIPSILTLASLSQINSLKTNSQLYASSSRPFYFPFFLALLLLLLASCSSLLFCFSYLFFLFPFLFLIRLLNVLHLLALFF